MDDFCFLAELIPHLFWLGGGGGDVWGHVGLFVAEGFVPAVFVFFADALAVRVAVVFAEVESVDAPNGAVDDVVGQGAMMGL